MTVSYSINGKSVTAEELKEAQITKKDYIDYIEAIKQSAGNYYREQGSKMSDCGIGKEQGSKMSDCGIGKVQGIG